MCDRAPIHIPGNCPPLRDPEEAVERVRVYLAEHPEAVERIRVAVESLVAAPRPDPAARAEWERSG